MEPKNHPIDKGKSPSPNPPLLEFHGEIFRGIKQAKTRKVFWINLEHSMTMSQWNKQTANRSSNLSRKIIYIDTLPKTNVLAPTRRPGHKRKTHLPTPSVLKEGKFLKLSFEPPWLWDPSPGRFDGCAWQLILGGGDPVKPAACMYFFVLLPPPQPVTTRIFSGPKLHQAHHFGMFIGCIPSHLRIFAWWKKPPQTTPWTSRTYQPPMEKATSVLSGTNWRWES